MTLPIGRGARELERHEKLEDLKQMEYAEQEREGKESIDDRDETEGKIIQYLSKGRRG